MQQRIVGPFSATVVVPTRVGAGHRLGPSRKQVRGAAWRRTSHGYYVPTQTPRTPQQRIAEASVVVPARAGLTGWAALRWMGGRWFEGTAHGGRTELPVTVATGRPDVREQPGIATCEEGLGPGELTIHDGLSLTSAVRSTCFAMRYAASLTEAVVVADMAAFSDLVCVEELGAYLAAHPAWTGIPQARKALPLVQENSWSPMESRLRVLWQLGADLPAPLVNVPVFDLAGRHLATPDLLDREAGLVVEYDGADHLPGQQRLRDLRREDLLRGAGLSYLTVLAGELRDPDRLITRLRRARRRAAAEQAVRRWTDQPPPWWDRLDTVDRRRAHRHRQASA